MYVALAARPLPKWFHLILSVLLFNLSCAIVYVYIMTRNITTSTERFEAVPSYVVAVLVSGLWIPAEVPTLNLITLLVFRFRMPFIIHDEVDSQRKHESGKC